MQNKSEVQKEKILIVGPSWVGDMVMAQTLFITLKQQNPQCEIDVLAPAWSRPILDRMPEVHQAIDMPIGHGKLNLKLRKKIGLELKQQQYTQAIVLPNSFKSALIPAYAGIKKRTGWRGELRWGLLNDIRQLDKKRYPLMIERFIALGLDNNSPLPEELPRPKLSVKQSDIDVTLSKYQLNKNKKILVLCPGAEFGVAKKWPAHFYAEIAKHYLEQNWQVWLLGSDKDKQDTNIIQEICEQQCKNLAGETSLSEAVDLIACASLVVSNDSGLMHIASALDRKLVVIYGSTSADFTPPLAKMVRVVALNLPCSPCFDRQCRFEHYDCLKKLSPMRVLAEINQLERQALLQDRHLKIVDVSQNKLKLAFCIFKYFPYGGLERDFLKTILACRARGHDITVYTRHWMGEIPEGLKVVLVPIKTLTNHRRNELFAEKITPMLQAGNYDVVIGFNKMPGLDVYFAGDPCYQATALNRHGSWIKFLPRFKTMSTLEESVFARNNQTKILMLTETEQQNFQAVYNTEPQRFFTIPPSISKEALRPADAQTKRQMVRRSLLNHDKEILLLMVGSNFRTKGVDRSIIALANLPEDLKAVCKLIIVGQGKPEPHLHMAKNLGIAKQIKFLGGRDDVNDLMLGADLLLHPSKTELAGMALLEAMANGLPIIASEHCGYSSHIVAANAGWLIPDPFVQHEFEKILEKALRNEERALWGDNGYQYALKEDLYGMAETIADLIEGKDIKQKQQNRVHDVSLGS